MDVQWFENGTQMWLFIFKKNYFLKKSLFQKFSTSNMSSKSNTKSKKRVSAKPAAVEPVSTLLDVAKTDDDVSFFDESVGVNETLFGQALKELGTRDWKKKIEKKKIHVFPVQAGRNQLKFKWLLCHMRWKEMTLLL